LAGWLDPSKTPAAKRDGAIATCFPGFPAKDPIPVSPGDGIREIYQLKTCCNAINYLLPTTYYLLTKTYYLLPNRL